MKQQINLYQPIFRAPRKVFSAQTLAYIFTLVAAGLAVIYAHGYVQVKTLERQVAELGKQRDTAVRDLENLRAHYPRQESSPLLREELARTSRLLGQARALVATFEQGAFGNPAGMSGFLEGLARQHVTGTWLTKVAIRNGGADIGVYGKATDPELVPEYVARLAHEAAFVGKTFSHFEMALAAPDPQAKGKETVQRMPGGLEFAIETERLALAAESTP